eukprot:TRINITY_DN17386_c0_g1_i1.p1 TRINITY_DN17386_c0_g1~~TRINITY_DN17386_c0_g1_i1.p1  ORF type:complete len:252 (+),score=43.90 TRINITY_DN17386_c0_g1_i1:64-819(+)
MSVTLHVSMPHRTFAIDAPGEGTVSGLRADIASIAGMQENALTLMYQGERVEDGVRLSEYPFEDQGILEVEISKRQRALQKLKEMGWQGTNITDFLEAVRCTNSRRDTLYHSILETLDEGGMCDSANIAGEILLLSSRNGLVQCAHFLLQSRLADSTFKGWFGLTSLHHAATRGDLPLCAILVAHGAKVDAADDGGTTPLHYAASRGHVEVLSRLLECGADPSCTDFAGLTPCETAKQAGHLVAVEVLSGY